MAQRAVPAPLGILKRHGRRPMGRTISVRPGPLFGAALRIDDDDSVTRPLHGLPAVPQFRGMVAQPLMLKVRVIGVRSCASLEILPVFQGRCRIENPPEG